MKNIHTLALSLVAGALLLAGCGKKDDAAASGAAASASTGNVIELTANDSMKFSATRFEVSAGSDVKVILTNIGSMPKAAMAHNWALLKKTTDVNAFSQAAVSAVATDYIPASMQDQVIAHTKMLGPKQSDEISFKAPTEPGEYPFICSFPAHFQAGMKGVLVVK